MLCFVCSLPYPSNYLFDTEFIKQHILNPLHSLFQFHVWDMELEDLCRALQLKPFELKSHRPLHSLKAAIFLTDNKIQQCSVLFLLDLAAQVKKMYQAHINCRISKSITFQNISPSMAGQVYWSDGKMKLQIPEWILLNLYWQGFSCWLLRALL